MQEFQFSQIWWCILLHIDSVQ